MNNGFDNDALFTGDNFGANDADLAALDEELTSSAGVTSGFTPSSSMLGMTLGLVALGALVITLLVLVGLLIGGVIGPNQSGCSCSGELEILQQEIDGKLSTTGGTMTGPLSFSDPSVSTPLDFTLSNQRNVFEGNSMLRTWLVNHDLSGSKPSAEFVLHSVAVSGDGSYQLASDLIGQQLWSSSDSGRTWFIVGGTTMAQYTEVSVSADGTRAIAGTTGGGNLFVAQSGIWTDTGLSSSNWNDVDMSNDGRVQVAVDNVTNLYVSTDFGQNWSSSTVGCRKADVSGDGSAIVYITHTSLFRSTDNGASFTEVFSGGTNLIDVAMSQDGTFLTIVTFGTSPVWNSADSGATWNTSNNSPVANYLTVAMSADGQQRCAGTESGTYTSADFGATWTLDSTLNMSRLAMAPVNPAVRSGVAQTSESSFIYLFNYTSFGPSRMEADQTITALQTSDLVSLGGSRLGLQYYNTDAPTTLSADDCFVVLSNMTAPSSLFLPQDLDPGREYYVVNSSSQTVTIDAQAGGTIITDTTQLQTFSLLTDRRIHLISGRSNTWFAV
jgi:hypothetical protein